MSNELQQLLADRRSERGEPGEFDWMERASDQQLVEFIERPALFRRTWGG